MSDRKEKIYAIPAVRPEICQVPFDHISRSELLDKLSIREILDLDQTLKAWGVPMPEGVENGSVFPWHFLRWEKCGGYDK